MMVRSQQPWLHFLCRLIESHPLYRLTGIKWKQIATRQYHDVEYISSPPMCRRRDYIEWIPLHITHKRRPSTIPIMSSSNLEKLPLELLYEILKHLQPSSHVALHLCSRTLQRAVPTPRPSLLNASHCEREALKRYLYESETLRHGKRRCILCRTICSIGFFKSASPICQWHEGWFMALTSDRLCLEQSVRDKLERIRSMNHRCWIAMRREYCAHSREVIGWSASNCRENCNSCGHFEVTCYIRISPLDSIPRSWQLVHSTGPEATVVEAHLSAQHFRLLEFHSRYRPFLWQNSHRLQVPVFWLE
jgi:hypothetical protein